MPVDEPLSFGKWIRRRRKALDLTQAELARRVGWALPTIKKIEADERRPSSRSAELLADGLQIPAEQRDLFLRVARCELRVAALGPPTASGAEPRPLSTRGAEPRPPDEPAAGHLPAPTTALLGRERQLTDLGVLFRQRRTRLVTLVGPPGIGKTRLAIAAAAQLRDRFRDGVWFVPLAHVASPALVTAAIAAVLGVRESEGQPLDQLLRAELRTRQLLLVVDNLEHLLDAAGELAGLLEGAPDLALLATSREALRLRGEHVFPVPALALPPATHASAGHAPVAVSRSPAVLLFMQRAREAQPDWGGAGEHLLTVAEICRQLDGLPLAIELAAAHARFLTAPELLARLGARLDVLRDGPRDLPPRQQTLRSAISWSYELLPAPLRQAFAQASVFAGGWTLDAADAVLRLPEGETAGGALQGLAQKSLVQTEQHGDSTRFALLESLRAFAGERLREGAEEASARARHATYYADLARRSAAERRTVRREWWQALLEREHGNLRAALDWYLEGAENDERDRASAGVALAADLGWFWAARGHAGEGRRWGERARGASRDAPVALRARLLLALGDLAMHQEDMAAARRDTEAALELFRAIGDAREEAWALYQLGLIFAEQDRDASEHYAASLALFRETEDLAGMGAALGDLGRAYAARGEYGAAQSYLAESAALLRERGDRLGLAWTLYNQGHTATEVGDTAAARAHLGESLTLFRALEAERGMSWVTFTQGVAALQEGDLEQAEVALRKSLAAFRASDGPGGVAWALLNLARALFQQSRHAEARACCEEALALGDAMEARGIQAYGLEVLATLELAEGRTDLAAELLGRAALLRRVHSLRRAPADEGWYAAVAEAVASRSAR